MNKIKKIKLILMILLSVLLTNSSLAATLQKCVKVDKQEIESLFDRWNDSLKSGDAYKVDANYTDNAVLLSTLSNTPRVNRTQRIEYFKRFLTKHPTAKIDSRHIKLACNKAIDTGLYTFMMDNGKKVSARYTFTYRWDIHKHKWLISSHHSSMLPENNTR